MPPAAGSRDQRLPVRLFNAASRLVERVAGSRAGFTASLDDMHAAAAKAACSDDFGDASYLDGLRVLADAYDREASLTPFGRMMVSQQLLGILTNRLVAERAWKQQPQMLTNEIRRPIFVIGLPRTGTTALHHLLGQDERNQALEYWLAEAPQPRPPRDTWAATPAFKRSLKNLKTMYWLDPDLKAIHLMTADGPEECRHLMQQSFTDDTFDCNASIQSYTAWYGAQDMTATYERHRDLLKLIGSTSPERRWLLKYPVHMANLDTLFAVYPDACIVQTHRDPGRVLPSVCSLIAGWRGIYENDVDRVAIGRWQLELWARRLEHFMEARARYDPAQFIDLDFREIVDSPVGAVERIYDHFDIEMTEQARGVLAGHADANPRGKHGEHRYRAADFELTDETMGDRFAAYIDHHHVVREHTV